MESIFKFALRDDLKNNPEFLPTKANKNDTGYDVRAAVPGGVILTHGQYFLIPLGFRMFIPPGWYAELRPRSSTFTKKHLHALYGIIDENFSLEPHMAVHFLDNLYANSIKIELLYFLLK